MQPKRKENVSMEFEQRIIKAPNGADVVFPILG